MSENKTMLLGHGKERKMKVTTYFCRLCRKSDVKLRKNHLETKHNTVREILQKRATNDLLDTIFIKNST
jgi:hypothetical protein